MAQFRSTADILDEILQEAGEPTNGNSLFETTALTAANHVHHAIIGGGSIFNLNVDEPWVWARSKQPIIFELQSGVTAQATLTNNTVDLTFLTAPSTDFTGWHMQVQGESTVYKIINHDSAISPQLQNVTVGAVPTSGSIVINFNGYNLTAAYNDNYSALTTRWNSVIPNGQLQVNSDLSFKMITVDLGDVGGQPLNNFHIVSNTLLNGTASVSASAFVFSAGSAAIPMYTAQLDSDYLGTASGTKTVKLFKLDYKIQQSYFYIDTSNDRLDYVEGGGTQSLVLTHGTYSAQALADMIAISFSTTAYYGVWWDPVTSKFALASSQTVSWLGASGQYAYRSVLPTLGFNAQDYTGAQSYTAADIPNKIARMIEPFKVFLQDRSRPFIYSTDPIKMQEDYPISMISSRTPDRFSRLSEDPDGSISVRFNTYPSTATKVQVDWIEQPADLQDNSVSKVKLPRSDLKTFIYAAASFIMFQKEDTKFESMLGLAKAGLEAMKKKNHGELFRTGESFGQQVTRPDLARRRRHFGFGYTNDGGW